MKKITSLIIISYLILSSTQVSSFDETCDKYLDDNPEVVLQRLKANPSPEAQLCVGTMYYKGLGVRRDVSEAVKWIEKSAIQGNALAQTRLGVLFLEGEGVNRDDRKAYEWFLKASQQEYARAQYYLGGLYYEGNGVDRNIIEAIKWFKKASNHDYELAKKALHNVLPVVSWKNEVGDFKGLLILVDESGTNYPNDTHLESYIEQSNYLSLKAGDEFIAAIGVTGCNKDSNGKCTETVSIALFGPDWSLKNEFHDRKLNLKNEDLGIFNDTGETFHIFVFLSIEPNDPPGQYRIVSVIRNNNKPRMELNQVFWVHD